jgi:hypothetical protein
MYSKIVNPKTGRKVHSNSKLGNMIISNYLKTLQYEVSGGGPQEPHDEYPIPYPGCNKAERKQREEALNFGPEYWGKYDSDLPDELIIDIAGTEGEEFYNFVENWKGKGIPPIIQSIPRYNTIAFVRGTVGTKDWMTDLAKLKGHKTDRWNHYVTTIQNFLSENRNIKHLICHSLGLALAYYAVVGFFDDVKIVGLDGAQKMLNEPTDLPYVRNINSDSKFDREADPWGPVEKTPSNYEDDIARALSAGHNAFRYEYNEYFKEHIKRLKDDGRINIQTGYFDGIIRSDPPRRMSIPLH